MDYKYPRSVWIVSLWTSRTAVQQRVFAVYPNAATVIETFKYVAPSWFGDAVERLLKQEQRSLMFEIVTDTPSIHECIFLEKFFVHRRSKAHCINGHPRDPAQKRGCAECQRIRNREYKRRVALTRHVKHQRQKGR